jgi:hypothetical protein
VFEAVATKGPSWKPATVAPAVFPIMLAAGVTTGRFPPEMFTRKFVALVGAEGHPADVDIVKALS